ncbi:cytosolic arginine sensor for mTORC1 subunit 1 isoform X2 [Patagioenas fasciata]|uniref:cytosolic arginine sensor for mTORC1 subunit 1 isoform X2 n=1 Tax=Patagioenas fasciata TaxID=372321 RepID=UPI0032E857DD
MDLHILEHRVRVLSLARRGLWLYTHPLLKLLFLPQRCRCKFFSLTETPEDYTIMLDEEGFKELPPSEFMQVADSTWLVLSVVSNGRAASGSQATGVTKIARSVIAPLAEHHVSVLMLSTYQTDFILVSAGDDGDGVPGGSGGGGWGPRCPWGWQCQPDPAPGQVRERDLPVVIHTLAGEFDIYKEESGECVPVTCDDVSNGFLKPKPAASPTLHPVQSPQTRFCVLTVAPDTLPAIATMLIDVLFYSHSPPREPGATSQDLDSITFFAFSLIEGYISIVMDAETQKRFPSDLLLTSSTGELWRMVRIGGQPLGFDECGIVAQIAEPLAAADISAYYISTFNFDHALVPEEGIAEVIQLLQQRQDSGR